MRVLLLEKSLQRIFTGGISELLTIILDEEGAGYAIQFTRSFPEQLATPIADNVVYSEGAESGHGFICRRRALGARSPRGLGGGVVNVINHMDPAQNQLQESLIWHAFVFCRCDRGKVEVQEECGRIVLFRDASPRRLHVKNRRVLAHRAILAIHPVYPFSIVALTTDSIGHLDSKL